MGTGRGTRWSAAAAAVLVLATGAPSRADDTPAEPPESAAAAPAAAPAGFSPTGSWQLLAEVNSFRRAHGLRPLKVDPRLAATARAWAERMASADRLSHNDALFSGPSHRRLALRAIGENVGFNLSVTAQHKAFLASPHHRANVALASFRVAGVAVVRDKNGYLWSVEDFGTPRS
jgi:uncharacterized protein YkwD